MICICKDNQGILETQIQQEHEQSTVQGQRYLFSYRLLFQSRCFPSGFLESLKGFVEFGDYDGHGQGEKDHRTEYQDTCDYLSQCSFGIHVPVTDLLSARFGIGVSRLDKHILTILSFYCYSLTSTRLTHVPRTPLINRFVYLMYNLIFGNQIINI